LVSALTEEQFKAALPADMRKSVNPLLIMRINNIINCPEEWENFKENLLSYTNILQMGKFKMESYINAVRYVGFKVMGFTNKDAYRSTFPDKYAKFIADGVKEKDIASYSTAYNKSKLVNLIFEQTLIPTHILNAPLFQKALNVQADIMNDPGVPARDRTAAANSLLTHLKAPVTKKLELDIEVTQGSVIEEYQQAMAKMVSQQLKLIAAGGNIKQITNAGIKNEEVIDI